MDYNLSILQQPYEYDAKFKGAAWTSSYVQMGADNSEHLSWQFV